MLVLIIGEVGSGKSLIMVIFALYDLLVNILSNFHIKHPNFQLLELDDFLNISEDTDVYIDEAYKWLESRRSSKASNVYISHIKEQRRKTNSTWYVSAQHPELIDRRFKEFSNCLIECKTRYPIGHSTDDFVYKITYQKPYQVVYKRIKYEDADKYFKYFNTNEIVEPENKQKIEYEMIKNNPKKLKKKVIELVSMIKKDKEKEKFTKMEVKGLCMDYNIIFEYSEWIYLFLNRTSKKEV